MQNLPKSIFLEFITAPFDLLALAHIDFKNRHFESVLYQKTSHSIRPLSERIYFDLASLTKPLSNGIIFQMYPEKFDSAMIDLLNHRAGLPSWAILGKKDYRDFLMSFDLTPSQTIYSDLSSLRLMLELEKKNINLKKELDEFYKNKIRFWTDTTFKVHDPNAFNLKSFCTHAGFFASIEGLCEALLHIHDMGFLKNIQPSENRFEGGWDFVQNTMDTLAGEGCHPGTFGHLGFTGTSIWIDPVSQMGHVILTNATKNYWHERKQLNQIRKIFGKFVWDQN